MSVTSKTIKNLILDAGVVYVDYGLATERILGATSGGNQFVVEREIREIEVDGVKGKVKGLRRIITENAMMTVNLKEMGTENIKLALSGSTSSSVLGSDGLTKTHDEIRSSGKVADADYKDNIAIVAKISGTDKPIVCIIENALSDGNFEIGVEDKNEAVVPVQFSAHYDPADINKVPYAIRYPVVA
jgi:hypothetical protein